MPGVAVNMDIRIDTWKKKLLDLSRRNRLLNYRESKRSDLLILKPSMHELWDAFVVKEKPISFPYVEEDGDGVDGRPVDRRSEIETSKSLREQQKTLRNLRNKARSYIMEQGVNALYLAFGFVKWRESSHSDQWMSAPLILVPATLKWDSIVSPFVLTPHDDEIVLNPTLAHKFESDFGIVLPPFDAEVPLGRYLDEVREMVSPQGWTVADDVSLSLLSFLKIGMYEDLERHRDGIKEHPVIKALAGDVSDLSCDVSFLDNYDHDANSSPENVYQVLDADASQMDAITCAKKGVSFVLQGPPGTGKSQTITNIIAECMADGKKVLFVSEKMAALDVVHRRLKDSGLDDFCLVLHSHKANKKDVLAQLGRSLDLSGKRVSLKKDAYSSLARLTESRAALNTYESELHTQIKPLNMTIYEANGWVAKHDGAVDLVFDLPDVRQVSRDKLASMLSALRRYSLVVRDMGGSLDANPWRGSNLGFVGNEFRHDLSAKSKGLMASLSELSSTMQELDIECGVSAETFSDLSSTSRLLGVAALSPGVPACWVWTTSVSGLTELAAAESAAQVEYFASVDRVNSYLESHELRPRLLRGDCSKAEWEPVFSTVLTAIEAQYAEDPLFSIWRGLLDLESFESFLSEFEGHSRNLVGNKDATSSVFSDEIYTLDHKAVRGRFDFDYTPSFLGLRESYYEDLSCIGTFAASSILQADSDVIASELGKVARYIELQTWRNGCVEVEEYAALSADIATSCEVEINDIPYNDIYLRYKTASASFGKFLNSQYKADRALVASLMKGSVSKPADELVLDVLRKLRRRDELKSWMAESKELRELEELGAHLSDVFLPNVFEADYAGLRLRFSNDYTLDFKKTLTGYESDIAAFGSCYCGNGAISRDCVIEQLARCEVVEREKKWIEENEGKGRALLGSAYFGENTDFSSVKALFRDFEELSSCRVSLLKAKELFERSLAGEARLSEAFAWKFNGLDTDWDDVRAGLDWVMSFRGVHDHLDYVDADFANRVCEEPDFPIYCADLGKRIDGLVSASSGDLAWFAGLFESNKFAREMKVTALLDRVERCSANLIALEQWIDYRQVRGECAKIGLDNFVREVEEKAIAFDQITPAFEKRFYRLWLDSVLPEYPAVASFRGRLQNETVDEFRNLDVAQTAIARTRVKGKLVDSLPSLDRFTMGRDEVHILQRELNKQRRIMPLRKLFSSIPNLILMLKPCLMMSPLSVSLFLESDCFQFDVVIFDEASQVCTENAIGAILRGKQAVVAGDSKQLPPSTFFSATVSDEDYDEDDESASDANAFESLLDEASLLPERTLLWHYRSRHEHLIAFSNSKIYRNRLTTFPSCVDRVSDAGVEYVYVPDGTYDRGGRKGNSAEAAKVAELVFEHFRKHPNRSLGVIAFGSAQEAAIDAAVRKLRLKDQRFEKYFGEELDEPFFVKSLENVQGDERDTIVFSIGYAKSPDGIMRMQFGPLSQTGGERRLNVAITRAKHNVKLVGSILPTDIAVERISADGPKLLRSYIDFAMRGPDALRSEVVEGEGIVHDSPFEESVYDYLVGLGYELSTQVGCSGYRIDMAVKHPTLNGRYVLGIECDGAMYHSARTARERDRLRQDVLEGMGWRIHRIWSTDWVKDPVSERRRLVEAVEKALAEFSEDPAFTGFDAGEVVDPEYDFEEVVVKVATKAERTNPYGFSKMGKVNFFSLPRNRNGLLEVPDCIEHLVGCEYPIHKDLVCQRLCPLFGQERVSSTIKNEVNYALRRMDSVVCKDDFLFPVNSKVIPAYGAAGRAIKHISVEELASAISLVAGRSVGATRDMLIEETARAYGFNRIGANIAKAFNSAYDLLVTKGLLQEVGGRVKLSDSRCSAALTPSSQMSLFDGVSADGKR